MGNSILETANSNPVKPEVLGTEQVDPQSGLTFSVLEQANNGVNIGKSLPNPGGEISSDISQYQKFLHGEARTEMGIPYLQKRAYDEQSGIGSFIGAMNQGIVGQILGGTLEGIGYLGDTSMYAKESEDVNQKMGNWLTDVGKAMQTWSEKATPIYTNPDTQGQFRPDQWSWWMSNAPSAFSTLSLLIPAGLAAKGIGMMTELAGITAELGKAAPYLSAIEQGIMSRHMESMMEAQQAYDETYNDVFQNTKDVNKAREAASKAASTDYSLNWVMLAQDIPQYLLLGKLFPKSIEENNFKLSKFLKQPFSQILGKQSYNVGLDLLSEGGEEAYQYIVQQESRRLAKVLLNPDSYSETDKNVRIGEYLKDGDFWTNAAWGAIGAGVMHGANAVTNFGPWSQNTPSNKRIASRIQNLFDTASAISQASKAYRYAQRIGDPAGQESAFLNLTSVVGANAAMNGNTQNAQDLADNLANATYTPEELAKFGNGEEDVNYIKQNLSRVKDGIAAIGKKFDYYSDPKNGGMNPVLASHLAAAEWLHEQFKKHNDQAESRINQARNAIPRFGGMSLEAQDLYDINRDIEDTKKTISVLETELKDKSLSEEERKDIKDRLEYRKKTVLPFLRSAVDAKTKAAKSLSPEVQAMDKEIMDMLSSSTPGNEDMHEALKEYNKARTSKLFGDMEVSEQAAFITALKKMHADSQKTTPKEAPKPTTTPTSEVMDEEGFITDSGTPKETPTIEDEEGFITDSGTPKPGYEYGDMEITPTNDIEAKKADIERRREAGKQYYHLEGKPGDYYYYYNNPEGGIDEVHGKTEKEVNDKINAKYDAELSALETPSINPKETKANKESKVDEIKQVDNTSLDAIRTNPSHSNPEDNKVYPVDAIHSLISFKGRLGTIDVSGTFTSLDGKFEEELDPQKTLGEQGASVVPHSITQISFEGNTISIEGTNYTIPLNLNEAIGKDGQLTLLNSKKERVTFTNPIIVQEVSIALMALEESRLEVFKLFQVDKYGPASVRFAGKKYHVFYNGEEWLVTNVGAKREVGDRLKHNILTDLFSELDKAILYNFNANKYNERIDIGELITNVERPSEEETNNSPDVGTIQSPEATTEGKSVSTADDKQKGKEAEDKHLSDAASRLAENEAINQKTNEQKAEASTDGSSIDETSFEGTIDPSVDDLTGDYFPEVNGEVEPKGNLTLWYQLNNDSLQKYLLDPNNSLKGATVEFDIDFGDDDANIAKIWNPETVRLVKSKDKRLVMRVNPNIDTNIVDWVPIKAVVTLPNGQKHTTHILTVNNLNTSNPKVKIPARINAIKDKVEREKALDDLKKQYKQELRYTRARVMQAYLEGKTMVAGNLGREGGNWINDRYDATSKARVPNSYRSLDSILRTSASKVELGFSYVNGVMQDSHGNPISNYLPSYLLGNIFFYVGVRANGLPGWSRATFTKISSEHADIIFNALYTGAIGRNKFDTNVHTPEAKQDNRVWVDAPGKGMPARDVLDYLTVWNEEGSYEPTGNESVDKAFLGVKGKIIYYGDKSINLNNIKPGTPEFTEAKKDFVDYISKNKNYRVNARTIEQIHGISKQIGSLKLTKGKSNKEIVIENGLITSNIGQSDQTGSFWRTPLLRFDAGTLQEKGANITPKDTKNDRNTDSLDDFFNDFEPNVKNRLAPKKRIKVQRYSSEQLQKEVREINEMLPRTGVRLTDNMIDVLGMRGRQAWGQIRNNMITVYNAAEVGTLYHEAFHAVSQYYLTDEQRQDVYNEVRRVNPKLKKADDNTVEEYLAEEFRDYKLKNKQKNVKSSKIRQFFSDLIDFIYTFFTGRHRLGEVTIERLFKAIDNGKFKRVKPNVKNDTTQYRRRIGSFSRKEADVVAKNLVALAIQENNIVLAKDISKLDFKPVLKYFDTKLNDLKANPNIPNRDHYISVYSEIVENFGQFVGLANDFLTSLHIKSKPVVSEDNIVLQDEFELSYDDAPEKVMWDKNAYEHDTADNALANVKLFLATLPTGTRSSFTALPEFMNFHQVWAKLMLDVSNETNILEIIDVLKKKATENPMYNTLLYGVRNAKTKELLRPGLIDAPEMFRTQFEVSINKFRYNHLTIGQRGEGAYSNYYLNPTSSTKDRVDQVRIWGEMFQEAPTLISDKTKAINTLEADRIAKALKSFKESVENEYTDSGSLLPNISKHIERLRNALKLFNVDISTEGILKMASEGNDTLDTGFYKLISGSGGIQGLISFLESNRTSTDREDYITSFRRIPFINKVAAAYVAISPHQLSNIIPGANGNPSYIYGQNSYLTDMVKKLRKDKYKGVNSLLGLMGKNIYSTNSWFRSQLEEKDNDFNIATLAAFNNKAFKELTQKEDFLNRMIALRQGYIPLPTLADKNTYHFYTGIRRIDSNKITFTLDPETNNISKVNIPADIVAIFRGYAENEKLRIDNAKSYIDSILAIPERDRDYSKYRLIKYYHYQKTDSNGRPILKDSKGNYTGNAVKFIHFPIFNTQEITDEAIVKALKLRIMDTIVKAKELGLIDTVMDGTKIKRISNKALDYNDVATTKDLYKTQTPDLSAQYTLGIFNMMADMTLNSIMSTIETEQLVSGDIAFYKDAKDKLKRMNAAIASGDSLRTVYSGPLSAEFAKSSYSVATIKTWINPSESLIKQLYPSFVDNIKRNHKEKFEDDMSDAEAEAKATALLAVYGKNDPSDGEVLITPRMHRQILNRLGEWTDEMEEAYKLLLSDAKLSDEEEYKLLNLVMQPLKLVYYGMHYIQGGSVAVPTYDKMSMLTLFPRTVKGTIFEPLYNRMMDETKPIDCVKFDSAVKVGDRPPFVYIKEDGTTDVNALSNIVVTEQHYDKLKRQLRTDPKNARTTRLATQVKKLLHNRIEDVSRLFEGLSDKGKDILMKKISDDGKTISYKKLYALLNSAGRLSNMSERTLESLVTDDEGNPRLALDAFPDRLWVQSRIMSMIGKHTIDTKVNGDQYIQGTSVGTDNRLKLIDEQGRTEVTVSINLYQYIIPDYEHKTFEQAREWLLQHKDILEGIAYRVPSQGQNMVVPIVIKDVLPHYTGNTILVPYEFTTLTDSDFDVDKLFLFVNSYKVVKGKLERTEFVEPDEGNTITSDEKLAVLYNQNYREDLDRLQELQAIKSRLHNETINKLGESIKNKSLALSEFVRAKLDTLTELLEDYDITNIKPEELDKVIEDLKKTPTFEEFKKANRGKSVYKLNSTGALQNKLLQIYKEELTNKQNVLENRLSLGYIAKELRELSESIQEMEGENKPLRNLELANAPYQIYTKHVFTTAKSGVGPFVLAVTHGSLTVGTKALQFQGTKEGNSIGTGNLDDQGFTDFTQLLGQDGEYIATWLSGGVTANVDAAKDPYIFYLNVNRETWGVITTMLRAGAGIDSFYFLSQPGLKYMALLDKNPAYKSRVNYAIKLYTDMAVEQLMKEHDQKKDSITKKVARKMIYTMSTNYQNEEIFNKDKLIKQYTATKNSDYYAYQLAILRKYRDLQNVSWSLSTSVQASQVDTKAYGNSFASMRLFQNKINKAYTDRYLSGTRDLLYDTFLQRYKENSIDLAFSLFNPITIGASATVDHLFNVLVKEANLDYLPGSEKETIVRNIESAIYGSIVEDYYRSAKGMGVTGEDIKNIFEGPTALGKLLARIKLDGLDKTNTLLERLRYYRTEDNKWFVELPLMDSNNKDFKDEIKDSWEELLTSSDPALRSFGHRLLIYAFYESGTNKSKYSLFRYIPETAFLQTWVNNEYAQTFNEHINQTIKDYNNPDMITTNVNKLKKAIYESNWFNKYLVTPLDSNLDFLTKFPKAEIKKYDLKYRPIFNVVNTKDRRPAFSGFNQDFTIPYFKPYVTYQGTDGKTYLAKYIGYMTHFGTEFGKTVTYYNPFYRTIERKGYNDEGTSHRIYEYGEGRSVFEDNHLPYVMSEEEAYNLPRSEKIKFTPEEIKQIANNDNTVPYTLEWKENLQAFTYMGDYVPEIDDLGLFDNVSENELTVDTDDTTVEEEVKMETIINTSTNKLEPKVGDIVSVEFYFAKDDKLITVKSKVTEIEKVKSGETIISDSKGNELSREGGSLEYSIELERIDGKGTYSFMVGEDGYVSQTLGKNGKLFIGSDTYIPEFDLSQNRSVEETKPVVEQRQYTPENLTKANMPENGIFVFGSNTLGKHGLGAASVARKEFGAIYGQAKGRQGRSYAIITKDLSKGERSIPLDDIAEQLTDLFDYADQHPELTFYVTKIGTALAGYTIEEMKSTFERQDIPNNVILPKEFEVRDVEESPFLSDEELQAKGMKVGDYNGPITSPEELLRLSKIYLAQLKAEVDPELYKEIEEHFKECL